MRLLIPAIFSQRMALACRKRDLPSGLMNTWSTVLALLLWTIGSASAAAPQLTPGSSFRDCTSNCPELVVLPPGSFMMGSSSTESGRDLDGDEDPQHFVTIAYPFAVGRFAVTREEFRSFARGTKLQDPAGCNIHLPPNWPTIPGLNWHHTGFPQNGHHPVVCVSWKEAQAYVRWLSHKAGHEYRLLSEAEWEYAARSGTTTADYWGDNQNDACAYANGVDLSLKAKFPDTEVMQHCHDGFVNTAPVGSFRPNAFGLYDMMGNVFEMLADCYAPGYARAPTDGSSRNEDVCRQKFKMGSMEMSGCRVNRGGSWTSTPSGLRAAARACDTETTRVVDLGFRVARRLESQELANLR
jgi:formylglycine-generating enzyme required for sulfatase activity